MKVSNKLLKTAITLLIAFTLLTGCDPGVGEEIVTKVIAPTYKPTNLRQIFSKKESIRLTWDNVSSRKEFIITRSTTIDGVYTEAGRSQSNYYTDYGLTEATIYYYRVHYINSDGVKSKESDPFTAVTAITMVTDFKITSFDADLMEVVMQWTAATGIEAYEIQRESNNSGKFETIHTITTAATTTYTDKTIDANTRYRYKIIAYKEILPGIKSYSESSAIKSVTINKAIPQGISITGIGKDFIQLDWLEVRAPALDLRGYMVLRAEEFPELDGSYTIVETIPLTGPFSYKDENLHPGKAYYYKIATFNPANEKFASEYEQVVTPPPPAGGVQVDNLFVKDRTFQVNWMPMPATANMVNGFFIYLRTVPITSTDKSKPTMSGYVPNGSATKYDTKPTYYAKVNEVMKNVDVEPDTEYHVYVQPYYDPDTTESPNNPTEHTENLIKSMIEMDPADPTKIIGTTVTRTKMQARTVDVHYKGAESLILKWDFEDNHNIISGITTKYRYHIYRTEDAASSFDEGTKLAVIHKDYSLPGDTLVVTPAGTKVVSQSAEVKYGKIRYTNSGLVLGKTYYYKVKVERIENTAVNPKIIGNESVLPELATTTATELPETTGLTYVSSNYDSITLSWNKEKGVPHYIVYRQKSSGGTLEALDAVVDPADLATGGTYTFIDKTVEYNVAYDYYVKASTTDKVEQGLKSNTITNKKTKLLECTTTLTATTVNDSQITLNWTNVTGVDYYTVTRKTTANPEEVNITVAGNHKITGTTVTATGLAAGTKYTFTLYAHLNHDTSSIVSIPTDNNRANGYTCPGVPANLNVDRNINDLDTYKISWTAAAATETVKYKLYRWMSDGSTGYTNPANYEAAGTNIINNTQVPDSNANLTPFKEYYYMVKAYIPGAGPSGADLESTGFSTPAKGDLATGLGTPTFKTINKTYNTVSFTWDVIDKADKYIIYRDGAEVFNGSGTSFTDGNESTNPLSASTEYTYIIKAITLVLDTSEEYSTTVTTNQYIP